MGTLRTFRRFALVGAAALAAAVVPGGTALIGSAGTSGAGASGVSATATGPIGYTVLLNNYFSGLSTTTCQLASVDLGGGTTATPIGPSYSSQADGCPYDLAMRPHDPRIFAVVEPLVNIVATDLPAAGASGSGQQLLPRGPAPASAADSTTTTMGDASTDATSPTPLATSATLVTIDPATGVRTPVGPLGFDTFPIETGEGLAFDAAGTLWFYGISNLPACVTASGGTTYGICLFRLDPGTGAAMFVAGGSGFTSGNPISMMGATSTCATVVGSRLDFAQPDWRFATLDTATAGLAGAPSTYDGTTSEIAMTGIENDALGVLRGIGSPTGTGVTWATYTVDPATGLATKVADLVTGPTTTVFFGLALPGTSCYIAPTFAG